MLLGLHTHTKRTGYPRAEDQVPTKTDQTPTKSAWVSSPTTNPAVENSSEGTSVPN